MRNPCRWDLNPGGQIMGENQTSGNQIRDVDHEQVAAAKWNNDINMTPSTRLRGQLDEDELFGFSVDQRSGQPNLSHKIISPCTVVYKECQKNQALDSASHCVDGCGEFMRRGNTSGGLVHTFAYIFQLTSHGLHSCL